MFEIERLDHFVIPVSDVHAIADFYVRVLNMRKKVFGEGRVAVHFGPHKINLQPAGRFDGLAAPNHLQATADFCLVTKTPLPEVMTHLEAEGVAVIEGPGPRTGALGEIMSVYFRDPDGNLVEISNYE